MHHHVVTTIGLVTIHHHTDDPLPLWATPNLISVSRSLFSSIFVCFLDSKYEWKLQYLSFSFWLIFHLTPSRSIHVLTKGRISFFLMAEEYPCVYVCVAHRIFFIYSSISGHLCGLYILIVVKSVAMNIGVHVPFQIFFKCFSNK